MVTLSNDKLIINLKDYVDWVIYSREYTEDDIGKDIHRKMELSDVYNSFYRTQPNNDEENMKAK